MLANRCNPAPPAPAKRIVSLVPSQTELLYALGLDEEVVAITKFCVHPPKWFTTKPRIGGTKTVNIEAIKALQPDLIIGNKEENVREQVLELEQYAPVFVTDVATLQDALEMIEAIGKLVDREERANQIAMEIKAGFEQLKPLQLPLRAAYLIWKDPYMAAGGDTFINDMLCRCGFSNLFSSTSRYPEVVTFVEDNLQQSPAVNPSLSLSSCSLLLLSSEPYPFKEKHVRQLQQLLPDCKIVLVDGEMFSWYGSRLLLAPDYFKKLIEQIQG